MTIDEMRCKIIDAYPGLKWRDKCLRMPTNQVYAVYKSLEARNFDTTKKAENVEPEESIHQIDMFEFIAFLKVAEKEVPYEFKEEDDRFFGKVNGEFMEFESESQYRSYINEERYSLQN